MGNTYSRAGYWAICHNCKKKHHITPRDPWDVSAYFNDWNEKHLGHQISLIPNINVIPDISTYGHNADIKTAYGSSTALTLTLASLASSATAGRECTAVNNASNLYIDAVVMVKVALQTGTPANDKAVYLYAYGSEDGSTYTDNATGTDNPITLRSPSCTVLIGVIPTPDSGALTYEGHPVAIAPAFGGILPRKWGIIVRNYTGCTLSATEGHHSYNYTGVYYTSA